MVGATTLQPGEATLLELPVFMGMHKGMGGPHVFAVDIRTNDPVEPVKTLRWKFTVENLGWKTWIRQAVGTASPAGR